MSAPLDVEDLITPVTEAQAKASLFGFADGFGLVTTAWQKLSPLRTVFAVCARLFAGFSTLQAQVNAAAFLDTATKGWLTLLAYFVYGVTRIPATYARGTVTITNGGGGVYPFGPGDLVVINTTTKKTYANVDAIVINSLEPGLDITVQAIEAGSASTAAPTQIDGFVAASPQLTVTNAEALIGDDEELDEELRDRCRAKLGSLSAAGPQSAYEYFAKTPTLNGGVDVVQVKRYPAVGDSTVRVVVASSSGEVPGSTGDASTDLGKVFLALNKLAVPAGYTLLLDSAVPLEIAPNATIYVDSSFTLADADGKAAVLAALAKYVPTIPIGGVDVGAGGVVLYRALEGVMRAAAPGILEAKLDVEADILLAEDNVAVLGVTTITIQVVP